MVINTDYSVLADESPNNLDFMTYISYTIHSKTLIHTLMVKYQLDKPWLLQ